MHDALGTGGGSAKVLTKAEELFLTLNEKSSEVLGIEGGIDVNESKYSFF